ncbi:MAG: hypothetical protein IH610_05405 [Deltaproteobacteria bacterium]|nr:hypothetical protein [Deltaproteobacteria bacterium]
MRPPKREGRFFFPENIPLQIAVYAFLVVFMSNINSLVDLVFHPEAPYWSQEHLILGGITGIISFVVFGFFLLYVRNLQEATDKIKSLESILPICSNCKKIRKPGSDPSSMVSWQEIEPYITEHTSSRLSHGVCPECFVKLYPGVIIKEQQ